MSCQRYVHGDPQCRDVVSSLPAYSQTACYANKITYSTLYEQLMQGLHLLGNAIEASQLSSSLSIVRLQVLVQDGQRNQSEQQIRLRKAQDQDGAGQAKQVRQQDVEGERESIIRSGGV